MVVGHDLPVMVPPCAGEWNNLGVYFFCYVTWDFVRKNARPEWPKVSEFLACGQLRLLQLKAIHNTANRIFGDRQPTSEKYSSFCPSSSWRLVSCTPWWQVHGLKYMWQVQAEGDQCFIKSWLRGPSGILTKKYKIRCHLFQHYRLSRPSHQHRIRRHA